MDNIICNIDNLAYLEALASLPDRLGAAELTKLGFTAFILPETSELDLGLAKLSRDQLDRAQNLDELISGEIISSEVVWDSLIALERSTAPTYLPGTTVEREQAAMMLQMTLPRLPIYDLNDRLIAGTAAYNSRSGREFRELLRSLTFWRTRFRIEHSTPRLVHADDFGLLIYIIDSWLVALNFTGEDMSVDIGTGGAMWLMLATGHDVHLHGSLLDLPPNSGAILANELAR